MIRNVARSLPKCSARNTEPAKLSLSDQATVTFPQLAVKRNRSQRRSTSSYLPPSWSTSTRDETFSSRGSWGSAFPEASGIKSSRNGYLVSRTTKGSRSNFSHRLSSSSSVRGLPSKPWTRYPGVSKWRLEVLIPRKFPDPLKMPKDL